MISVDTLKQNRDDQCGHFKTKQEWIVWDILKQNRGEKCGHFKTKQG